MATEKEVFRLVSPHGGNTDLVLDQFGRGGQPSPAASQVQRVSRFADRPVRIHAFRRAATHGQREW